jgi:hypothetical protein
MEILSANQHHPTMHVNQSMFFFLLSQLSAGRLNWLGLKSSMRGGLIHGDLELAEGEGGRQGEGAADLVLQAVPPDVPHVLHVRRVSDHHLLLFVVVAGEQALDPLHEPLHPGRDDPR